MRYPVDRGWPITQPFGVFARVYTDLGYLGHHGVDIGTPVGAPVLAAAPWECHTVRHADPTAGSFIVLQHPNGLLTRYLHLSRIDVGEGDTGPEGHPIGLTGDTGLVTGPHLHFEVVDPTQMDNGYRGRLDPELFLEDDMDKPKLEDALNRLWDIRQGFEAGAQVPEFAALSQKMFDAIVDAKVATGLQEGG